MLNKKTRKILLVLIFVLSLSLGTLEVLADDDIRSQIIPTNDTITIAGVDSTGESGLGVIGGILKYIKDSIFGLLSVIAIGMFIFIGVRLVKAEGNPEEMAKTWKTLIHVIVGLFIVSAAWAIVAMVSGTKL